LGSPAQSKQESRARQHLPTKVAHNPRKRLKERKHQRKTWLAVYPLPLSKQKPHVQGEKLRRVEVLVLAVGCRLLAGGSWLLVAVAGCFFLN